MQTERIMPNSADYFCKYDKLSYVEAHLGTEERGQKLIYIKKEQPSTQFFHHLFVTKDIFVLPLHQKKERRRKGLRSSEFRLRCF